VASLSQGRTAAAQCGLFTHKSVPVIFEPPCINKIYKLWTHLNKKGAVFWYVRPYAAPVLYPEDGGTRFLQSVEIISYCARHIPQGNFLCYLRDILKLYIKTTSA